MLNSSLWPPFVGKVAFWPIAIHSSYSICETHKMSLGSNICMSLFFLNSKFFFTVEMCSSWKAKTRWEIERVNIRHEKTGWDWTSPIQWTKCIRNWFPPCLLWFLFPLWCWEERLCIEINSSKERECNLLHAFIIITTSDRKLFAITEYFLFWFLFKKRKEKTVLLSKVVENQSIHTECQARCPIIYQPQPHSAAEAQSRSLRGKKERINS